MGHILSFYLFFVCSNSCQGGIPWQDEKQPSQPIPSEADFHGLQSLQGQAEKPLGALSAVVASQSTFTLAGRGGICPLPADGGKIRPSLANGNTFFSNLKNILRADHAGAGRSCQAGRACVRMAMAGRSCRGGPQANPVPTSHVRNKLDFC